MADDAARGRFAMPLSQTGRADPSCHTRPWREATQLAWDTDVDPERGIIPELINPLVGIPPTTG